MSNKTLLGRFAVGVVVAASLAWAAAQPASATTTIARHGYWSSVIDRTENGERLCGVRTRMENGGELQLVLIGNDVHLIARDSQWELNAGGYTRVTIFIDGTRFSGKAKALGAGTLMVPNLARDFVARFINGYDMAVDLGGVRWNVSLVGSSNATREMVGCSAGGGWRST